MPALAEKMKGLVLWMSREITQTCCLEFFQRKLPLGKTFSNYKSFSTSQLMAGIVPHGHIMCILVGFRQKA